eukprot:TRINITY_DN6670_c0_g3_i3.p1 TRINITY_DN6670_c0_g3~~TRINITY_DN6670_c0_g3_i3.p1  ORF type:complete len:392 (-),score=58.48 TRINITY_DN6670_c0_g3_i3:425-1600(-)
METKKLFVVLVAGVTLYALYFVCLSLNVRSPFNAVALVNNLELDESRDTIYEDDGDDERDEGSDWDSRKRRWYKENPMPLEMIPVSKWSKPELVLLNLVQMFGLWEAHGYHILPPMCESVMIYAASTDDVISSSIISTGQWDINKLRQMLEVLMAMPVEFDDDPNVIPFVDVGSHVGWFGLIIAAWGFRVHSFEPLHYNNVLLSVSIRENEHRQGDDALRHRITHHPVALDAEPNRECFIVSAHYRANDGHSWCGISKAELADVVADQEYLYRGDTTSSTLDIELPNKDIYLLKINVNEYEERILTRGGASSLFKKQQVHHIISRVWSSMDIVGFLKFFRDLGYDIRTEGFDGTIVSDGLTHQAFVRKHGFIVDVYMKKRRKQEPKLLRKS